MKKGDERWLQIRQKLCDMCLSLIYMVLHHVQLSQVQACIRMNGVCGGLLGYCI